MTDQPQSDHRPPPPRPVADDEISFWEVLAVILRRRGTIVWTTLLVAALTIVVVVLRPETFTTAAMFRPQGSQASASQLTALASQFGVAVPGAGEEASPAFYAEIVTSREILEHAALRTYEVDGVGAIQLKDLLEIERDTEPLRDEAVIDWLRDQAVSVSVGRETGTVTVGVKTEWPDLSHAIAQDLLSEVSRFNLETRQSQAAAERVFIEGRVEEAEADLMAWEDSLRLFLEANRQVDNSPLLRFRMEGLQRQVNQRQSVLTTLVQSFEEARISEVRDTPVITVLQSPFLPPGPDEKRLVLAALLGLVLGGAVGTVMAFLVEGIRRPTEGDPAREDFRQTWEGFKRSIPLFGRRA